MKLTQILRGAALLCAAGLMLASQRASAATIVINNLDPAGVGFNDPTPWVPTGGNPSVTLGAARLYAFQFAANIWAGCLQSTVPIQVDASFGPIPGCTATSGILGQAGPKTAHFNFPGAPLPNTLYPQALANSLAGVDLDPTQADIQATFNSDVDNATCLGAISWYYGVDGSPPASGIDLVTVVLHELGHGLGFLTFVNLATGARLGAMNDTFMLNLENHGAVPALYPAMNNAQRVAASIADPNLHWTGPLVLAEAAAIPLTGGFPAGHVRMHGPNPAVAGSSVSHFSVAVFPDQLMEPSYTGAKHDVGMAFELMRDIGWNLSGPRDLWMQDTPTDVGAEPDTDPVPMWISQDIWVRNLNDGLTVHENPEYRIPLPGQENYVNVRVRNKGCKPASGTLKLYWAKASTGLDWSTHWDGTYVNACAPSSPFGGEITPAQAVVNLLPGSEQVFVFPWFPQNPMDYTGCPGSSGHFCLLARIETSSSAPYGMTFPETTDLNGNVLNNNNIVWKNVTVVDNVPGFVFSGFGIIANPSGLKASLMDLCFRVPTDARTNSLLNYAAITVDLGADLFARWQAGGGQGQGVEPIGSNQVAVLQPNACLFNIFLEPDDAFNAQFKFTLRAQRPLPPKGILHFDVVQSEQGRNVGGLRYDVDLRKTTLVRSGSNWKYRDDGSNQGTAWRGRNFNDSAWNNGPAELGFGNHPVTVINGGPATNRFITTYFRKSFVVADPSFFTSLVGRLKRDDGAVVYLNGTEVWRSHMPAGTIAYNTLASAPAVEGWEEDVFFQADLSAFVGLLVAGVNVVAVEVHQDSPTSPDLGFDFELLGNVQRGNVPPVVRLGAPAHGKAFLAGRPLPISLAEAYDPDGSLVTVEFYANNQKIGQSSTPPYSLVWSNPPAGLFSLTAVARDNQEAQTTSSELVVVRVAENLPPQISLTATNPGGSPNVTVTANATDDGGTVAQVEFYQDGVLVLTDKTAPFGFTTTLSGGDHLFEAIATDNGGLTAASLPVVVNVAEPPRLNIALQGKTVLITWPGSGYRLQQSATLSTGIWTDVPGNPQNQYQISLPGAASQQFFRLSQ